MKIVKSTEKHVEGMMAVARKLHPGWFDPIEINESMPVDFKVHRGYLAVEKETIVGFITYTSDIGKVLIGWMGVAPEFQRRGIGSALMGRLEWDLQKIGVKELRLRTIAESTIYQPYERTRAFYKRMGFVVEKVERTKSKDTGQEFDIAIYIKRL